VDTFIIFYVCDSEVDQIVHLDLSVRQFFSGCNIPTFFGGDIGEPLRGGRHAMNMNAGWQELYRAAMLELRPDELRRRIDDAEKAIQQRILELTQNDSSSEEERRAIEDALRGLRDLASTECKPPLSANLGLAQNKTTPLP
jgi:hypothetical protein